MSRLAVRPTLSEPQFAAQVDGLIAAGQSAELIELLREDHPVYDQRGAAAVVRMRGWILLGLGRIGLTDAGLLFILEELDTGRDPYIVAAAARTLRSYPRPDAAFAPFLIRAFSNIRFQDEPVAFDEYGQYAIDSTQITPIRELLASLVWLGPLAHEILSDLRALQDHPGSFASRIPAEFARAIAIIGSNKPSPSETPACCSFGGFRNAFFWSRDARRRCESIGATVFEDQNGDRITFAQFFRGYPSVVLFFYTRCDNPQKCSLTIAKLARLQGLLTERGLNERIRTGAITYDPAYDGAERLRGYGINRGVRFDPGHRMLRPIDGIGALRTHFKLGVNFIESLVNRHRIEVYVLDEAGAIAASYERIHWSEEQIVDQAVALLSEDNAPSIRRAPTIPKSTGMSAKGLPLAGTVASLGFVFFPKCPFCWAAYLSVFGIAGLDQLPYAPWLKPVFGALIGLNVFSVWLRSRVTRRATAFFLVASGALMIAVGHVIASAGRPAAWLGVGLTLAGSFLSAVESRGGAARLVFRRATTPGILAADR